MSILIDILAGLGFWCLASLIALAAYVFLDCWRKRQQDKRVRRQQDQFMREASAELAALIAAPGKTGSEGKAA